MHRYNHICPVLCTTNINPGLAQNVCSHSDVLTVMKPPPAIRANDLYLVFAVAQFFQFSHWDDCDTDTEISIPLSASSSQHQMSEGFHFISIRSWFLASISNWLVFIITIVCFPVSHDAQEQVVTFQARPGQRQQSLIIFLETTNTPRSDFVPC